MYTLGTYHSKQYSFMTTKLHGSKEWYRSKTLWYNVIVLIMGVFQLVSGIYVVPQEMLTLALGLGNLLLRFLTAGPIHIRQSQ